MKVISINVGLPRQIKWKDKVVVTSIFKTPVTGSIKVRKFNLEGDAQADLNAHGGEHRAVFVYQKESYDFWNGYLKNAGLKYGQFGENLTVEGLSDLSVYIGDQYQIGSAIFEVTQPRVTCYKVAISTGVPEMPALLVAHKRPGFYFRVLQEGEICAGDPVKKLVSGPETMSVAEIDQLLYSSEHPQQSLEKALKIPALSDGWRLSFNGLLQAAISGVNDGNAGLNSSIAVAWTGFKPFIVKKTQAECQGVRSFEFTSNEGLVLPDYLPGQHIALRLYIQSKNLPIIRMYSLCGPPHANFYRIAVKRAPEGLASCFLHDIIKEGDVIEISAPRGEFVLSKNNSPLLLLSAGIGITPLLGMLYTLSVIQSERKIYWLHATQNGLHQSFGSLVEVLGKQLQSFQNLRIYSKPGINERIGIDYDFMGRLNLDLLKSLNIPVDAECYLCGPAPYLKGTTEALLQIGIPNEKIRFEAFSNIKIPGNATTTIPHLPTDNIGTGPIITFTKSNISFRWQQRFNNLLEAAEAADIPVLWSCRVGVCHRCESGCLDGQVTYEPQPFDNPARGNILLCCAKPQTDIQIDL